MFRGRVSEWVAALRLQLAGYRIIQRNYRRRGGEIDLIACKGDLLVFVEVRFRSNARFATALESVDHAKQLKLLKCASEFVQKHPAYRWHKNRFDVVAIDQPNYVPHLTWTRSAFLGDG